MMKSSRSVAEPVPALPERFEPTPSPARGPRLLFFSGGTALRDVSRLLKGFTWNSVHVVTPFDSGGSSAALRQAFGMLSIGDLRNRLLSLADETRPGVDAVVRLVSSRLPREPRRRSSLPSRFRDLVRGADPAFQQMLPEQKLALTRALAAVAVALPDGFELAGASVGNLVLTGQYLLEDRDLGAVLDSFSRLAGVKGRVLPSAQTDAHLAALLADGTRRIGQHRLTGKEESAPTAAIDELYLVDSLDEDARPIEVLASPKAVAEIGAADLLCYPIGSFHTSVVANLLPRGIGRAITAASCPRVYVPNTLDDPEQVGMDIEAACARILSTVRRDAGDAVPASRILDHVVLDRRACRHAAVDVTRLRRLGIGVIERDLVSSGSHPAIDPLLLVRALLSIT